MRRHRAGEVPIDRALIAPAVFDGSDKVLFCQRFCGVRRIALRAMIAPRRAFEAPDAA
jgi:hypothetical protein